VNSAPVSQRTLFCLHYLGGSGKEFDAMGEALGSGFHLVPIDLAGFGAARDSAEFSVAEMVRAIAAEVQAEAAGRWWLVGHSMGAKVATGIASQIESGALALDGLENLVLLAGSPPSPEPMEDDKRGTMLGWFRGDEPTRRADGESYIRQNVTRPLSAAHRESALRDLERMNPAAWIAWLESGSREDWSGRVGTLRTPALLIAGADDESLGADAQKKLMAPHFANAGLRIIEGASHLLPLEAASEVARLIADHARELGG